MDSTPGICDSSYFIMEKSPLLIGINSCYGFSLCNYVSLCYDVILCNGVSLCFLLARIMVLSYVMVLVFYISIVCCADSILLVLLPSSPARAILIVR